MIKSTTEVRIQGTVAQFIYCFFIYLKKMLTVVMSCVGLRVWKAHKLFNDFCSRGAKTVSSKARQGFDLTNAVQISICLWISKKSVNGLVSNPLQAQHANDIIARTVLTFVLAPIFYIFYRNKAQDDRRSGVAMINHMLFNSLQYTPVVLERF